MPKLRAVAGPAVAIMAVVAATWLLNAETLEYGFVYDDQAVIIERPPVWEQGWMNMLGTRHWGTGRHAVLLSFDANRAAPPDPRPFHATNVALAAAVSVLVYLLGRSLGLQTIGAFAAALLFTVHPTHTDAVVSIVGRAELMAALAVLAALLLHLRGYPGGAWGMGAAACMFALGLSSKESAVVLLPLLALCDVLVVERRPLRERLRPYAAYLVALAAWLALVWANLATLDPITYVDNPLAHVHTFERAAKAAAILWHYAALLIWPYDLLPDRSFATTDPTLGAGLAACAGWTAAALGCWYLHRRRPVLVFGLMWFPAAFAVTANIAMPVGTIMAERLLYLPSVGPALLAGMAIDHLAGRGRLLRVARGVALALAALVLAFAYDARARYWTSDAHYHEQAAVASASSAKAHYNLGLLRARQGRTREAEVSFGRALAIYPAFARATYYRALALVEQHRHAEAAAVYRAYLELRPSDVNAHSQLLEIQLELGDYPGALATAQRLIELEPDSADRKATLGSVENAARRHGFSP